MKREDKLIRIDNMAKCQVIPSLVSLLQAAGEMNKKKMNPDSSSCQGSKNN